MTVFNKYRYTNVALPKVTHKLVKHVAQELGATLPDVIATGMKLLQEKLEIPDPPTDSE